MKRIISIAMILIAITNILTICATSLSISDGLRDEIPAVPQNLTCVNTAQGVSISWDTVENTAGYIIYRANAAEEASPSEIANVKGYAENTYVDTTAKGGAEYLYFIKSYNAFNESELSTYYSIMYIGVPSQFTAKVAYGGIRLKWNKVKGAASYCIYKAYNGKFKELVTLDGDKREYLDTNVKEHQVGSYMIVAVNGVYSSASAQAKSTAYLKAPVLVSAKNGNGYVTVTWKKTSSADGYYVYRKTKDSSWVRIKKTGKTESSYKDTAIKNNTQYIYTVKAYKNGYYSGYDTDGISAAYIAAPTNVNIKNKADNLRISWNAVKGVSKYTVYKKASGDKAWVKLGSTNKKYFDDKDITNGKQYYYRVKATSSAGAVSGYSQYSKQTALKMPGGLKASNVGSGVRVYWSGMSTATRYAIYRKAPGQADWKKLYTTKDNKQTEYTDYSVETGKKYSYAVRQYKGNLAGSFSKNGVTITHIEAPSLKLKHTPYGISLNWNKCKVGNGYELQRKVPSGKWKTIAVLTINTLSYTDQKPVYGKKNYYRVIVTGYDKKIISNSKSLYGINPNKKLVALTYDDGPNTDVTNSILDTLSANNSRATFFVVGSRVNTYASCIKREASLGCEIANHTYNHTTLTSASANTIKSEINKTNNAVKALTGVSPTLVRAPGGAVNDFVKNTVRYPLIQWSVDTLDWKYRNSASVVSNIKSNVRDGSIVLMHDLYGSTAQATKEIVPWLIKNGYQIVTVSELMAVRGIELKSGSMYFSATK